MRKGRLSLWAIPLVLWGLFTYWYTNTSGPLTQEEVERYLSLASDSGLNTDTLRQFLETDTGNQFIMINVLDMAANPPDVPGATPGETADELMGRYMEYMWPALLSRGCHPIFFGEAVAPAMDIVGIEGAQNWSRGGLMRYRSRRDLMEIAMKPIFTERHDFKIASLEKTIAYPVESILNYSDPRFLLGLILFALASLIDLLLFRRMST